MSSSTRGQIARRVLLALDLVRADRSITGAALGRALQASERTGQYYRTLALDILAREPKPPAPKQRRGRPRDPVAADPYVIPVLRDMM